MQNAFISGIMLTGQTWLSAVPGNDNISYDPGRDSERVKTSRAVMVNIPDLRAIDVALSLGLTIYITLSYTWTSDYEAAEMTRQSVACADGLPPFINSSEGQRKTKEVLQNIPD